ncbi:MAG: PAS domain S-box protein [Acidobacteria bacterium]|nr:PAS domain S-box protein [Acidobacteriota bacterium]
MLQTMTVSRDPQLARRPIKLCLIDDDPQAPYLIEAALSDFNLEYALEVRNNFSAGLAALTSNRHDVYLVDYRLPGGDGLELIRGARREGCRKPIVMLTGFGDDHLDRAALAEGAADYVEKGLLESHLGRAIRHAVDRAAAETAFREREVLYRRIVETAHDGIWAMDVDGRTTYVNHRMAAILGIKPSQMLGRSFLDFVHPEERAAAVHQMERLRKDVAQQREFRLWRRGGRTVWTLVATSPIWAESGEFSGALAMVSDISELKLVEQELVSSNRMLNAILDAAPVAIATLSSELIVERWNLAAERTFGWNVHDVVGQPYPLACPDDREDFARLCRDVLQGSSVSDLEGRCLKRDGTEVPVSVCAAPLRASSPAMDGLVLVLSDLSTRKRMETQLRRSQEQLLQSQKMEAVGRLAGGIAHDFNNLLTVILSYCEALESHRDKPERVHRDLSEITGAADRAAALTRQLLAFSRRQLLQPKVMSLNDTIETLQKMWPRLIGEDVETRLELASDLWPIKADPHQIEQVLLNLVVNARDAMPRGGLLAIRTANIGASDDSPIPKPAAGQFVEMAVSDSGIGMDPATKARIFEPFFTTKEVGKGTGLGLATVYGIVEQSGGKIVVESESGRGATFRILFPRVDGVIERPTIAPASRRVSGTETILVVEDDDAIRHLTTTSLELLGYRVLNARDGNEALAISHDQSTHIDLLVTDVIMPGMSGPELVSALRVRRPAIPYLYVSGYTDDRFAIHGVLEPGNLVLQKPFTPVQLAQTVREILEGRRGMELQ